MVARIAIALVALLVIGWLGISLHDVRLQREGIDAAFTPGRAVTPAGLERATSAFHSARLLNPDVGPLLYEGGSYVLAGQPARGIPLLERALRREPRNVRGWALLESATSKLDPQRSRAAAAQLSRLRPNPAP